MATTQPEDLADTIRSRSQHFHFRALSFAEISDALVEICGKEGLTAQPGAIAVMARAAEGSLRDGLSLLEQARAYCGSNITDAQVRELLGVVPGEILDELTGAIEERSAERVLSLVHRLLAEGQNLQHFCREAIGHFRNLLVARVCGADSELIAAPADERPRLKKASEFFSEEDLTRFFQILLHTDEDLRRKPDARLHLEMGLLRMVNAARLAPLEELLADLEGGDPEAATPARSSSASAQAAPIARASAPAEFAAAASQGASTATAPARMQAAPAPRPENAAPSAALREETNPLPKRADAAPSPAAMPGGPASMIARTAAAGDGLVEAQVDSIKNAILTQEKFLGELVGHASRWEMSGGEVRLFFPTESRALAEMLQARDPMERLRNVASRILGQMVRVCVKLEAVTVGGGTTSNGTRELRAKFEQDPIVRAMLERFGGQISDVKRRGEE
jgi:DNA polymerase III gamma/tau subunit